LQNYRSKNQAMADLMESGQNPLTQFSISEPSPGYWKVVFSNPPINMLNSTTVLELGEIVRRIEEAQDLRVVVFASEDPDFYMARYDLSDTNPVAFAPTESGVTYFIDSMLRMNDAGPITIASIRGRVRGGGSEFALSCDMRFASIENSVFGQPEVGVGIVPAGGAVERLPGLVGTARALEIIASADDYDAVTAERYGWINRALPDTELDDYVDTLARRLASFDPQVLATTKRLVRGRTSTPTEDQFRETLESVRVLFGLLSTAGRRAAVVRRAADVGADFELRMGHHLGLIRETTGAEQPAASLEM
jgi:enoyl-CoA hydratase/carnithine racemase